MEATVAKANRLMALFLVVAGLISATFTTLISISLGAEALLLFALFCLFSAAYGFLHLQRTKESVVETDELIGVAA